MKSIFSITLLTLGSIGCGMLTSCDAYIDITPQGAMKIDSAYNYYELIVNPMRSYWPSSFYMLSDNAWAKESNIIGMESRSWDGINFTFNESADRSLLADNNLYENMYSDIMRCNLIIDNISTAPGADSIRTIARAEARSIRAFNHFLAVNTFAKAYDPQTAQTDAGVCIMDHYDLEAKPSRSTVEQVYAFIIKELEECVGDLQTEPLNIYHPNRAFGYGMLAKAYLFHHDWDKAAKAAQKSLDLNSTLIDYNIIQNAGGIARCRDYCDTNNPEVLSYAWMGSGWTNEVAALYAYGIISLELVNLFEPNDLRYSLFFRQSGTSISNYFDEGSGAAIWTPANTSARFTYITVGLRTAEVLLMLAEAQARQNLLPEATANINLLRRHRLAGADTSIATPGNIHDMMQTIILERRKELQFGFHRFFDLKRFNLEEEFATTIVRRFPVVTTSVEQKTYTLQPNSPLYIIPIPNSARDRNPNL